jgi:hypothetical protein
VAPLSAAEVGGLRGRSPAVVGDTLAVAEVSARHDAERDLHRLALAARRGQDRAPPARLPEDLAYGAGARKQTRALRDLLLAGDGAVPRQPYAVLRGQAADPVGHGRGDEPGAARAHRAGRGRLQVHPDRGAVPALHGQHFRQGPRRREVLPGVLTARWASGVVGSTPAGAIPTCSA